MNILLYVGGDENRTQAFLQQLENALPDSRIRVWQPNDHEPADYALVWKPPVELLAQRAGLKAVIYLAAGVEYLVQLLEREPDLLPKGMPLLRIEDAGMGQQMVEYVEYNVLRYFRNMHEYERSSDNGDWTKRKPETKSRFSVGVMGMGVLGQQVAQALAAKGFPVRGWSRSPKEVAGIECYASESGLKPFLNDLRVLVNLLPLTPETDSIMNSECFAQLQHPAYIINIGRGHHLVEQDLLDAIGKGHIGGAALDVFRQEPLPAEHAFWKEPRISITPHIAAVTLNDVGATQVIQKLRALERDEPVTGVIDLSRGY